MKVTIDSAGRVVIPIQIREKIGITAGTEMEIHSDGSSVTLIRTAPPPKLVRRGKRLVVVPSVDPASLPPLDIEALIEEERQRWPL